MWLLYQLGLGAAAALAAPWLWWRKPHHYGRTLRARLRGAPPPGRPPKSQPAPLWLHAVSVGEVSVAATLARALPADLPLLLTTVTPTGQERARSLLGERAAVTYLPFDFALPVRRFLAHHRPRGLVLVEGDYWPLLLREVTRRTIPVAVVSGRISDRSFPRLLRWRRLVGPLFDPVSIFAVQGARDRERLLRLGVPAERVTVAGNLKFDGQAPPLAPALRDALLRVAAGRVIVVAGSTMPGEEELVAQAQRLAGGARALWLVAPRHPERFDAAAQALERAGLQVLRRSRLAQHGAGTPCDAVLIDTLGELAALYALARGAFVGGTLVQSGGHNPLEPARCGAAIAAGPSMFNFQDIADEFDRAQAWQRVADAQALGEACRGWCLDATAAATLSERAAALLERHRGATARSLALLAPLLAAPQPAGGGR